MSITRDLLKHIVLDQQDEETMPTRYYFRSIQTQLIKLAKNDEIIVLSGVRRCGKSVLLRFIRERLSDKDYYFNFEDERLINFAVEDFQILYEVFLEMFGEQKTFYFDEIQNIPGWEMFVRRLYNNGNKIFITGSNANLFSEDLGTRLTGRYIKISVYPFSFFEYLSQEMSEAISEDVLSTKGLGKLRSLFNHYCEYGGIPAYLKDRHIEYLHSLYESIVYRDIVSRYNISNLPALKKLIFYLASNCSKEITYSSLRKMLGLGSSTTVSDYCSYLENSYLCFFVNRYSPSLKVQQQAPKKVYFVDHALAKIVGFRFSEDKGRMLENIVYLELRRRYNFVFCHYNQKECDFIVQEKNKIVAAIQVCKELVNPNTKQREFEGLLDALETHELDLGYILTDNEEFEEHIEKVGKKFKIIVLPLWKWLIGKD